MNVRLLFPILAVVLLAGQANADLSLITADSSGAVGAAWFSNTDPQSTGTGYIDSFVRVKKNYSEAGYNTDAKPVLNTLAGMFTHALLASTVPIVTSADVPELTPGTPYWEFLLDINEAGSEGAEFISLNELMFFRGTEEQLRYFNGTELSGTDLVGPAGAGLVYDLDSGGDSSIHLNYDLNPGSGAGDMFAYIPVGGIGDYLLLYSQFGEPGIYTSWDGFEEWAVRSETPPSYIPLPGAVLLGVLGLGAAGMKLRKHA